MDKKNTTKKLYNPRSDYPSVYIPCWLIQVSTKLLSNNAKMLYGRLSQWSNETGQVFRSCPQLAEELGAGISSIERHLKELKDVGLIGTYHPQAGGLNHYEFYDHEWMHVPINKNLSYKTPSAQPCGTPPSKVTAPPVKSDGTPPSKVTDINIKEIKINSSEKSENILLPVPQVSTPSKHHHYYDLFSLFNIEAPLPGKKADKMLMVAISTLEDLNFDLTKYLECLSVKCSKWLYTAYPNKRGDIKTNDFFVILRPDIIKRSFNGEFEDK
jgi:hypothetical protein